MRSSPAGQRHEAAHARHAPAEQHDERAAAGEPALRVVELAGLQAREAQEPANGRPPWRAAS